MIVGKDELFERIRNYQFEANVSEKSYKSKIDSLERAINSSVNEICREILKEEREVHLAFSGGVDSSLILVRLLGEIRTSDLVVAHTLAINEEHPDMVYAKRFFGELKERHINLGHTLHFTEVIKEDIRSSNEILRANMDRPDNYYMLMKILSEGTDKVICCDVIDELMGGYYSHRSSDPEVSREKLKQDMGRLIENHLGISDKMSSHFGIKVYLPYGSQRVMEAASAFRIDELVDEENRKKPIYEIAERNGVIKEIIERRKYGLVSAFDDIK
ncbi:MAG: asparagine synthase-related protein [archaeon]